MTLLTGLIHTLLAAFRVPVWLMILVGAVLLWQTGTAMRAQAALSKERTAHQADIGASEAAAREASERYRAVEHRTQETLVLMQGKINEESVRAESLEADVAAAVLRGERRVRASVCDASSGAVPGHAAAGLHSAEGPDDGARRIGATVRRLAEGDAEIRYLRSYADACQRTCGPAEVR